MPYTPPDDKGPANDGLGGVRTHDEQRHQELQVRLAAQHILYIHLTKGDTFGLTLTWTSVALTSETLILPIVRYGALYSPMHSSAGEHCSTE